MVHTLPVVLTVTRRILHTESQQIEAFDPAAVFANDLDAEFADTHIRLFDWLKGFGGIAPKTNRSAPERGHPAAGFTERGAI